jgi:hypothetical protein
MVESGEMDKIGIVSGFGYGLVSVFYNQICLINWNSINLLKVIIDVVTSIELDDVYKVVVTTIIGLITAEFYKMIKKFCAKLKNKINGKD